MNTKSRAAFTLVVGATAFPVLAQKGASEPASSSAPPENAQPLDPVQWFVAGVAVGIILTVAWIKIRGSGSKNTASA